jgi:nanoRNase/pAp phosphatase (c-di-AMP/oligoRNAs hydrolase)
VEAALDPTNNKMAGNGGGGTSSEASAGGGHSSASAVLLPSQAPDNIEELIELYCNDQVLFTKLYNK